MNKIQKTAYINGTKVQSNKLNWFQNSGYDKKETGRARAFQIKKDSAEKTSEIFKEHDCVIYIGKDGIVDNFDKIGPIFKTKISKLKEIITKTPEK